MTTAIRQALRYRPALPLALAVGMMLALLATVLVTAEPVTAGETQPWIDFPQETDLPASNEPRFQQVSAGENHTCGVKADGTVACWGENSYGAATPPAGTFHQVTAGWDHTCGVKTDGTVACWGDNDYGKATPPTGAFQQVTAGGNKFGMRYTCGVKADGTVACWGNDRYGQATPPAGTFQQVSAGGQHACGVKTDGTVACWGDDESGQATPPAGTFRQVSAGGQDTCGVRTNGWVECWGAEGATPPAAWPLQQVSVGDSHTCGVRTDGTVACWGADWATPPGGTFQQVNAGDSHTCGVKTDGTVACWGDNDYGKAMPPTGTFQQVSAHGGRTCGVNTYGGMVCWWNMFEIMATPPYGTFQQVSVGWYHACGLSTDGWVACWGYNRMISPGGTFQQVSVGKGYTCGVKTDGAVACWGDDDYGKATPPAGTFQQVSAGRDHACGVKTDGTVACWGDDRYGQATPPAGTFRQVSAGNSHTCGVKTDGTVVCWSGNRNTPSGVTFREVSAGSQHTCGVSTDGLVTCWGYNMITSPDGTFHQVSAGTTHTCGVTTDGAVVCWGGEARGIVRTDDGGIAVAGPGQPAPAPALGNPTNLQATVAGSGQVNLTWEPASNADAQFVLRYKVSHGAETLEDTLQVSGTAAAATVTGLEDGQSYVFVVIASRQVGGETQVSQPSNRAPVTLPAAQPPPDPLGKPTNVAATAAGSQVTVTWTDAPGAVGHLAMLFKADFSGTPLSGSATGGSHTFRGVPAGSYIAVVVALDASGKYQFGISAVVTVGASPASEDRESLEALYYATGGRAWTNSENWLTDEDLNKWHGVTTNDDGRVTRLELQGNNLVGSVPENVQLLTALELLRLEENDLSGCMPKSDVLNDALEQGRHQWRADTESRFASHRGSEAAPLWEFVLLSAVLYAAEEMGGSAGQRVAQNWFSPSISLGLPPCAPQPPLPSKRVDIGSQTTKTDAMALLDIYNYYVGGGRNPKDKTTKFDAGGGWGQNGSFMTYANNAGAAACPDANPFAGIHGVKTREINGCHRITSLSLNERGLNGEIPSDIARLGQLKFLNLSHNNLTGPIPAELGLFGNLHTLALNNNYLTGEIPEELGNLVGGPLEGGLLDGTVVLDLHLQENYLDGRVPLELANVPYLRSMSIDPQYYVSNGVRHSKNLEGCLPSNLELDAYGVLPKALTNLATRSFDKVRDGVNILETPSERSLDALTNELLSTKRIQKNRAIAVLDGVMTRDEYNKYVRELTGDSVKAGLQIARLADEHGFWNATVAFSLQLFVAALDAIDYYADLIQTGLDFITERIGAALGAGDRDDVACD